MQLKDISNATKIRCPLCKRPFIRHMKKWRHVTYFLPHLNTHLELIVCFKCYKNFISVKLGEEQYNNLPYFLDHKEEKVVTFLRYN